MELLPAHGMGMRHIKFVSAWLEQQNLNLSPNLRVRLFFIYKRTLPSDFKNKLFQVTNRYMLKSNVQHSHDNILMNGSRNNYSGFSKGNAPGIYGFIFFVAFSHKTQFTYSACVKCKHMRRMNPRAYPWFKAVAAFVDNSSLDVSERNLMAITLNIHTKSHTVRVRPTLKLVERFGNWSVCELYERSIYK